MLNSVVSPRLLTPECLARYLGLKRTEFDGMLPYLQKRYRFPNPMPQFGLYDRKVIDLWLDHASGITTDGRYGFDPPERHQLNGAYTPIRVTARKLTRLRSGNPYTIAEAMQDYAAWFRAHHRSPDTVIYKYNACILPHFGHRPVEDLTPPEIRAWHEAIAASPRSRHVGNGKPREYLPPPKTDEEKRKRRMTANGYLMTLKAAFNLAHRDGR